MRLVLIILVVAAVAKDASHIDDPYIMRSISQGLCLIAGGAWLLTRLSPRILFQYWPVFGYIGSLLLTSVLAASQFVFLQVLSLFAVTSFAIAYSEVHSRRGYMPLATLTNTTTLTYFIAIIGSLIIMPLAPYIAYDSIFAGDVGYITRFRGLFIKSGSLAAAAGILFGTALFWVTRSWLKAALVIPALACLLLSQSRTFWAAAIVASSVVVWFYYPRRQKAALSEALLFVLSIGTLMLLTVDVTRETVGNAVRADSVTNLTGRVDLWEQGIRGFYARPFLGYGFTSGSEGLLLPGLSPDGSERLTARTTLHSGYIQSLLDSGLVGTFFYVSVIVVSLLRLIRHDVNRVLRAECYMLVFVIVANFGENLIYSVSFCAGIIFWVIAVFALSLTTPRSVARHTSMGAVRYPPEDRPLSCRSRDLYPVRL